MDHFRKIWQDKHKIDIYSNDKARVRVQAAVEKLKKVLSANASAPINIEMVMNDIDVSGFLKREELEELVAPLLSKATAPVEQALADAKLKAEDIDVIELVGGASRVPALKKAIGDLFAGKTLSYTLNADEAVARGCAFCCAILSPVFRVRDFSIQDIVAHPIEFTWEKSAEIPDEDTSLTVFNKGNAMPSTKILTFYRKQPFDLEAKYAKPETLPGKINPWIGRFSVKNVKPDEKGDFMICKLKARLNLHGVLNIEQGYYVEDQEIEEPIPEDKDAETDDKAPKTRKVKKQVRKGDLPISAGTASLSNELREQYFEQEGNMQSEDKLVAETEDKKNELEGDIYSLRNKVDEPYEQNGYAEFASEEEKEKIKAKCESLEVSFFHVSYLPHEYHANNFNRTGFTRTARTPPRPSTSASTRSSAAPPPLSSSASTSAASRKRTSAAPRPRPRPRSSASSRRRRGRPMLRPRLPPRPQRGWPTSVPHRRPLRSPTRR
jgi:heat shock protein 4